MRSIIREIDFAYSLFLSRYNKYGPNEIAAATAALQSGALFYPIGTQVYSLERRLDEEFGVSGTTLVSSGTAAVHCALGAVGVDFADEVITTPLADTGTVIPIMLLGAVPVFADVDPETLMLTPETIEPLLSPRTKAIIVVHYGGFAAEIEKITEMAHRHGVSVVEDCAQAPGTFFRGRRVGTIGDVGAFSTNDTKHVSCGDGGFVLSSDPATAKLACLFHDKGFDRINGIRNPYIVAPNYRMTEIQAAILNEQWTLLFDRIGRRRQFAEMLDTVLERALHVRTVKSRAADRSSYFAYLFTLSSEVASSRNEVCSALCAEGIPARQGNLYDVLYKLRIFRDGLPKFMSYISHPDYERTLCENAEKIQESLVRIEMLEIFGQSEAHRFREVMQHHGLI